MDSTSPFLIPFVVEVSTGIGVEKNLKMFWEIENATLS